jgi:hypothetical protein
LLILLNSVHPKTPVFGFKLSAISFQLSAKPLKINLLADPAMAGLTAESSIHKSPIYGWTLNSHFMMKLTGGLLHRSRLKT